MNRRVNSFLASVAFPMLVALLVVLASDGPRPAAPHRQEIAVVNPKVPPAAPHRPDVVAHRKLIVFSATWCAPCQRAKPTVDQIEASGVEVVHYDIDANPEMAAKYGVTNVPTFFIYQAGTEVLRTNDVSEVLTRLSPK